MKKEVRFIILCLIALSEVMLGQPKGSSVEIWVHNYSSQGCVLTDSAITSVWSENFKLSEHFHTGSIYILALVTSDFYGFAYDFSGGLPHPSYGDTLGFAIYKIQAIDNNGPYFFLDLQNAVLDTADPIDIYLKIGASREVLYYKRALPCNGYSDFWHEINDGDTLKIWEIWAGCSEAPWAESEPNLSVFEPTIPADFSMSWVNGHVNLQWTASEPEISTRYQIWRKTYGGFNYSELIQNWTQIALTDSGVTSFLDTQMYPGVDNYVFYKIRAQNGAGDNISDFSNLLSTRAMYELAKESTEVPTEAPDNYILRKPFPNPFNPTTVIAFGIPESSPVIIQIFDISGHLIRSYHERHLNAGRYELIWDASNSNRERVSAGVYIVRMISNGFTDYQKIVYVK